MIFITYKKKKSTRKWNRTHYFQNERKSSTDKDDYPEHPALIFAQSGDYVKPIVFTHSETTKGRKNVKFKHNIDPDDKKNCYAVPYRGPRLVADFQPPKKNYRVHKDDSEKVKQLKLGYKKR